VADAVRKSGRRYEAHENSDRESHRTSAAGAVGSTVAGEIRLPHPHCGHEDKWGNLTDDNTTANADRGARGKVPVFLVA
jgi:hypothetical protein